MTKTKMWGISITSQIFFISLFGILLGGMIFSEEILNDKTELPKEMSKKLSHQEKISLIPIERRKLLETKENSIILKFQPTSSDKNIKIINTKNNDISSSNPEMFIENKLGTWDSINYSETYKPKTTDDFKIKIKFEKELNSLKGMISNLPDLIEADLSNLVTSQVTDMTSLFFNCPKLNSINLNNIDTSNVNSMNNMFNSLPSLTSLDVTSFNTSLVTDMSKMFEGLNEIISLNISNFNLQSIKSIDGFLNGIKKLRYLYLPSKWNKSINGKSLIGSAPSLFSGRVKKGNLNIGSIIEENKITWTDQGCEKGFIYNQENPCYTNGTILDTNLKFNISSNEKLKYRLGYLVGKVDKAYTFENTLLFTGLNNETNLKETIEKKGNCSIKGQIENEEVICNLEITENELNLYKEYLVNPKEEKIKLEESSEQNLKLKLSLYKLLLLGDSGVGKTCVIKRFYSNTFTEQYMATVGADFFTKSISIDGQEVKLQIWDISGNEKFRTMIKPYLKETKIFILMYDISNYDTFSHIPDWKSMANENTEEAIYILVGNKIDLEEGRKITKEEGEKFAEQEGNIFLEVSAKTGEGINDLFNNKISQAIKMKFGYIEDFALWILEDKKIKLSGEENDSDKVEDKTEDEPKKEEGLSTVSIIVIILAVVIGLTLIGLIIYMKFFKKRVTSDQLESKSNNLQEIPMTK